MPLILIKCHPDWMPSDSEDADTCVEQTAVTNFGRALPALFSEYADALQMDSCLEDGVEVDFQSYHPQAVNIPNGISLRIQFTEVLEREITIVAQDGLEYTFTVRDKQAEEEVKARLKELITGLLDMLPEPQIAVDCFWGPGRGWLQFGDAWIDW